MGSLDSVGLIHKPALVGSTSALFGLALIAVTARFLIRFRVQREKFTIDDGVLIFGLCTLIAAFAILHIEVIDRMYLSLALQNQVPGLTPPDMADMVQMGYDLHKWVTITLMLSWCSIMAAKLSILIFFWKLIDRIYWMRVYWWFVFILNLGVLCYGVIEDYLICPYFDDPRASMCSTKAHTHLLLIHSSAQIAFDLLGDLLILVIPVVIIYRIRIRLSQKLYLLLSLCLTVIMIVITIIRLSGQVREGHVDTTWQVCWLLLAGEVGIFVASVIACRPFFVTRKQNNKPHPAPEARFFSYTFAKKFRRRGVSQLDSEDGPALPSIPGGQLTGMRTFIYQEGRSSLEEEQLPRSTWEEADVEIGVPEKSHARSEQ